MIYVDTSAFLKLVHDEERWATELQEALSDAGERLISSTLLLVEARRAVQRVNPRRLPRLDLMLDTVTRAVVSDAVVESASRLPGQHLRSPDAIHLATALMLADDLQVLISYDDRLLDAAAAPDIPVAAPGR